jgi:hypothetical protein
MYGDLPSSIPNADEGVTFEVMKALTKKEVIVENELQFGAYSYTSCIQKLDQNLIWIQKCQQLHQFYGIWAGRL